MTANPEVYISANIEVGRTNQVRVALHVHGNECMQSQVKLGCNLSPVCTH